MDNLTCGICLDQLNAPVSTPCGHLCCEACLTSYIETSPDALNASCPTCRAPFSIAIPDLRFVPKKYHRLIVPSVRRIYITADTEQGPSGPRFDLRAQIGALNNKVNGLVRDKALLMDRCEAAIRARDAHAQGERDERLAKERLERELRELRGKYESVKGKYRSLKASSQENAHAAQPTHVKRTSSQAALDAVPDATVKLEPHPLHALLYEPLQPTIRVKKRQRLLGSPFDLSKRIKTRAGKSDRQPPRKDEDEAEEDEDSMRLHDSDLSLSSSVGPQRSGLAVGDIFSPGRWSPGGGMGSMSFERDRHGPAPAWLLSPPEDQ